MNDHIDFKKVASKSYRIYRILQAPGAWAQVYRTRAEKYQDYRSALIFPEQVLGIGGSSVYMVTTIHNQNALTSHIVNTHTRALNAMMADDICDRFVSPGYLCNMEEIHRFEHLNSRNDETHKILLKVNGNNISFDRNAWFTSLKDALKFQQREQQALLHKLG